jgi:hypothetical protein
MSGGRGRRGARWQPRLVHTAAGIQIDMDKAALHLLALSISDRTLWTHKIKSLHRNDFVMAAKTDRI